MQVHYLEIVSENLEQTCAAYSDLYGVIFSEPVPELGNARVAQLSNGGLIGIRASLHASEAAVVRPYMLVDDINGALSAVVKQGAEVLHPAMEIPGRGMFAIYKQSGVQLGLWQL